MTLAVFFLSISVVGQSLIISYFDAQPNPVYLDGSTTFTVEAMGDGVEVYLEDMTTGIIEKTNKTPVKFMKEFNSTGSYRFCASAIDRFGHSSNVKCITVSVITATECEPITMETVDNKTVPIAVKIKTQRIYKETSGFDGYPLDCCPYCKNIVINNSDCDILSGNLPDYKTIQYNYSINATYQNITFPENILGEIEYPITLCSARINENLSNIGIIDGLRYQPIEFVYNEKRMKYWLIQNTESYKTPYIFIPNSNEDTVSKIRTSDCSEVCRYPVGDNPSRNTVSPNAEVWVGNRNSNDVTRLNGSTCDVINKSIRVGTGPRAAVADEDGNIWIGNSGDDTVWKLNGSNGNKILQTTIGDFPYGAAIDGIGHVFVVNRGTPKKLSKINISDGAELWRKGGIGDVYGIAVDGNRDVWIGGYSDGSVYKVNGSNGNVTCSSGSLGGNIKGVAVDNDENVWAADTSRGKVHKVNNSNCRLIASYSVGLQPMGVAVDADGYVWVVNYGSNDAYKLRADNGNLECIANTGMNPYTYSSDMTGYTLQKLAGIKIPFPEEREDKYFLAEHDHIGDEKTYTIVDAKNYSNLVHELMKNEYYYKVPESVECQFDCPDSDPRCDSSCTCGAGRALGCPSCPPKTCECCAQFQKVYDYNESIYKKYEGMYGRPYTDYLFCYRTPLKDTAWCYQRMDVSTSTINYPWYAFTIEDTKGYAQRNIDRIEDEYINEMHDWNWNVEIKEKPVKSAIREKTWVPEVYCNWSFNNKLFRNIWARIFMVTPYLEDYRNDITWTRTGPGTIYAGGGFRREAACWWESCRRCGAFANCDCGGGSGCSGICCLNAYYTSGVEKTMKFIVPEVIINDAALTITPPPGDYAKEISVSNGALTVISTGNMEFTITSAIFTKDPIKGIYTLTLNYLPEGNYKQFVTAEDIVLNYELPENASRLSARLDERFTTSLGVAVCGCTPTLLGCQCLTSGYIPITTTESVSDNIGPPSEIMDEIKIDVLKESANKFVDLMVGNGIDVGLVAFSQSPYCSSGICSSHPLSTNVVSLHNQINTYTPIAGTCISCGINKGRDLLSGRSDNRYMIVVSDGVPNTCLGGNVCPPLTAKAEAISEAAAAKSENITVHTIALGDDADRPFMQQLANAGGGNFYDVTCDCSVECIYNTLANLVNNSVVLVNDVSGSMSLRLSLECAGEGIPAIYEFGRANITIDGYIDNYADRFIAHGGFLNITIEPDIMNEFVFNVGNLSLVYSSLDYPVKHNLYEKEFTRGQWIPGIPYAVGEIVRYGYMPGEEYYFRNTSYGYEDRVPSAVGFEFKYPEQGGEICPPECFCPEYDITDVTCGNYTTQPPTYYKRNDCICAETSQKYKRPITSTRTYHEEETYYYDFVNLVTFEKESLSIMGEGTELRPITPVGGLSGYVSHLMEDVKGNEAHGKQDTYKDAKGKEPHGKKGIYLLNFTAMSFPYLFNRSDLENSSITIFTHFRNDVKNQTFRLFPSHKESRSYATLDIDVTMRDQSRILIENVTPGRYNLRPGTVVKTDLRLINAITGEPITDEDITVDVESYAIRQIRTTDTTGRASFSFVIGGDSTKINFLYSGDKFLQGSISDYYDVVSTGGWLWWFLSPEVLLLIIALILIAFSYRWFKRGRFDIYKMQEELKGKIEGKR